MLEQPAVRRVARPPQQARSRLRVSRILDAAEGLLITAGYDALTIRQIAQDADVPTGTIYQFFPDKQAIVDVLAERYMAMFASTMASLEHWDPVRSPDELVDMLVDTFADLYRSYPGYRALWLGRHLSPEMVRADEQNNVELAEGVWRLLITHGFAGSDDRDLWLGCRVAVLVADALLQAAFRASPAGDPELIAHVKLVEKSYFANLMSADARAHGPATQ
jgi:AcrR family transcriptional regulator